MMQEDFYNILGVSKSADDSEIKKKYRKLARELHPDKNKDNKSAEERFKKVTAAYSVLSDKKKRKLYDEFGVDGLRDGFNADQWRQYGGYGPRGQASAGGVPGGFDFGGFSGLGGMEGLFDTLFGGAGGGRRHRGAGRSFAQKGSQLKSSLNIEMMDAILGRELSVEIPDGVNRRKLSVKVPQGVDDGAKIRLKGQGGAGSMGGEAGDLILELNVKNDSVYTRKGTNLEKEESITVGQAYFGDTVEIETPWGKGKLKIPEGTQGGRRLRVKGHGVRSSKVSGDLYVRLTIRIPEKHEEKTDEAVKLLEELY